MVPIIPTTEVQITVLGGPRQNPTAVILNASTNVSAKKNAGGMHLVFRYVPAAPSKFTPEPPPIEITFPDQDRAAQVFLPLLGSNDFMTDGIRLRSGEWVTTEIKPSLGLAPGGTMELPFDVAVAGSSSGSGRPDEPVVVIHC